MVNLETLHFLIPLELIQVILTIIQHLVTMLHHFQGSEQIILRIVS